MEALQTIREANFESMRLYGVFLPSGRPEGRRLSLRSTARGSFVNRAKTVACGYIGNILNRIGLQH